MLGNSISVERIKALGKEKSDENLDILLALFDNPQIKLDVKREIVSSIGRQNNNDRVFAFIKDQAFNDKNQMELIYQMFRTCLYKGKTDHCFYDLEEKFLIKRCFLVIIIPKFQVFAILYCNFLC